MSIGGEALLHMIKLAVGCGSPEDLAARQAGIIDRAGRLQHRTGQCPRRQDEILDGGSIYWVIRGQILLRQQLLGLEEVPASADERRHCLLLLDPQLVRTEIKAKRPFQGWRYLRPEAAPSDRGPFVLGQEEDDTEALPAKLRAELRALGLL